MKSNVDWEKELKERPIVKKCGASKKRVQTRTAEQLALKQRNQACLKGDRQAFILAIQNGASISSEVPKVQQTPLLLWSKRGDLEMVQWIVSKGGDLRADNTKWSGENALFLAIESNNHNLVEWVLQHPHCPAFFIKNGKYSALAKAVYSKKHRIAEILLPYVNITDEHLWKSCVGTIHEQIIHHQIKPENLHSVFKILETAFPFIPEKTQDEHIIEVLSAIFDGDNILALKTFLEKGWGVEAVPYHAITYLFSTDLKKIDKTVSISILGMAFYFKAKKCYEWLQKIPYLAARFHSDLISFQKNGELIFHLFESTGRYGLNTYWLDILHKISPDFILNIRSERQDNLVHGLMMLNELNTKVIQWIFRKKIHILFQQKNEEGLYPLQITLRNEHGYPPEVQRRLLKRRAEMETLVERFQLEKISTKTASSAKKKRL